MKRNDAFPSRFFKADDVRDHPTLVIADAVYETSKNHNGKDEQKLIISFRKTKKLLVCNMTIFDQIVDITGEADSDDWPGHAIQLYDSEVQVGSEMKGCVRVRAPEQGELKPKAAAAKTTKKPPAKADGDGDMDDQIPY
ncbi:MAG: hypothetical protein WCC81_15160 [Pseudolabrys sp.]